MFELLPVACYAKGFLYVFLILVGMVLALLTGTGVLIGVVLGIAKLGKVCNIKSPTVKNPDKVVNWVVGIVVFAAYVYLAIHASHIVCQ